MTLAAYCQYLLSVSTDSLTIRVYDWLVIICILVFGVCLFCSRIPVLDISAVSTIGFQLCKLLQLQLQLPDMCGDPQPACLAALHHEVEIHVTVPRALFHIVVCKQPVVGVEQDRESGKEE